MVERKHPGFSRFDAAEHLDSEANIAAYLTAVAAERALGLGIVIRPVSASKPRQRPAAEAPRASTKQAAVRGTRAAVATRR